MNEETKQAEKVSDQVLGRLSIFSRLGILAVISIAILVVGIITIAKFGAQPTPEYVNLTQEAINERSNGPAAFERAEATFMKALHEADTAHADDGQVEYIFYNLGELYNTNNRSDKALLVFEHALDLDASKPESWMTTYINQYLCDLNTERGDLEAAEQEGKTALSISNRLDIATPAALYRLSLVYKKWKKYDLAEQYARDAVDASVKKYPKQDDVFLPSVYGNLGRILLLEGKIDEGITSSKEAIALRVKLQGKFHPNTVYEAKWLMQDLNKIGRTEEAKEIVKDYSAEQLKGAHK